ncbi:MAG: BNR-4 repeat-containing protein, partial [Gemmatimonadota bacterium]
DNMMNLELLFRATEITGDRSFFELAVRHADTTLRNHFRPDGSSFHVLEYDPMTGDVLRKRTEQGHADASAWARGQAWALYGYTVAYRETGFDRYLEQARRIAHFYLTDPNLPADGIPYWDFDAPGIPDTDRDASAAAIAASALLELSGFVGDSLRAAYRGYATTALRTLSGPEYRTVPGEAHGFLLKHSVGSRPADSEVDVPLSYADYYYLEGLLRLRELLSGDRVSVRVVPIGSGWARSSVNAVVFRQHGIVSHGGVQYAAYYDAEGRVVLARRTAGAGEWTTRTTRLTGDPADAHNAISLGVDGNGVLHVSWDLHGDTLRYARGVGPGSLELGRPLPMTGRHEARVTYPRFYTVDGGDLVFLYRDGSSGDGDVMVNRYDLDRRAWRPLHHPLIDGGGERNAYVNGLAIDREGGWHLSWVWRESWDVATNHDILYAYSPDRGVSWLRSTGEPYALPITAASAEVAVDVPQQSGLINQTTMTVDADGRPVIASYWRDPGSEVPQYRLVRHDGVGWRVSSVGRRSSPFRLEGGGTRRIPLSRPLVVGGPTGLHVVFRDVERGGGISLASAADPGRENWTIRELFAAHVGLWEPVHDPVAWQRDGELHLLVQRVGQGEAETLEDVPPQTVRVLEWRPDGPA